MRFDGKFDELELLLSKIGIEWEIEGNKHMPCLNYGFNWVLFFL